MKISTFILCNSIENTQSTQGASVPCLVGPQVILRPDYIPTNFSFGFSIGITGMNLKQDNTFSFLVKSPEGEPIMNSNISRVPANPVDDPVPEEYSGILVTTDVRNMVVDKEGVYSLEFYVNDNLIGKQDIPIFKRR